MSRVCNEDSLGQVITVFALVLIAMWTATEWPAWRLGFQPELGRPWFEILHFPLYLPPAFFWWWYAYDAYGTAIFVEGAYIASSAGLIAAAVAIGMSVWRAREAKNIETYGSARWAQPKEIAEAGLLGPDGVVLGRHDRSYLRHDGPEHVLCFASTQSGKGVGLVRVEGLARSRSPATCTGDGRRSRQSPVRSDQPAAAASQPRYASGAGDAEWYNAYTACRCRVGAEHAGSQDRLPERHAGQADCQPRPARSQGSGRRTDYPKE